MVTRTRSFARTYLYPVCATFFRGCGVILAFCMVVLMAIRLTLNRHRTNVLAFSFASLGAACVYLSLDNSCMRRWEGVPVQTRWAWGECQVRVDDVWQVEEYAINYLKSKFAREGMSLMSSSEVYKENFKDILVVPVTPIPQTKPVTKGKVHEH